MDLTFKYEILLESKNEFAVKSFDTTFTSWENCQKASFQQLLHLDYPDHFGHPYIRYTSYISGTKIKSMLYCPEECGKNHHG